MTKILVIEDDGTLRDNIMMWLTFEGYEAIGAADGLEGVNQAFLHQPDLIVCDINMPHMDGYEVLLEIQSNSTSRLTPFIFLTAKAFAEDIRIGMALGADDYVTKPFERLDLLRTIQTRLDKKAALDAEHEEKLDVFKAILAHEREQRQLQAKLVAMFSHDFRTPLNAILITNSLLRDFSDKMDAKRRVAQNNIIDSSVRQLIQMLDDMLLIAQMESGKFHFQSETIDIKQFLSDLIAEFQIAHRQSQIYLESHFTRTIVGDRRLLRQIFANLISNAIKYSKPPSEIYLSLDSDQEYCIVKVKDKGIGIPEADLANLFDDFQRASNVGDIAGTGLGLAIVKQAITEHKGTISIETEVNVGTTFTVRLPLSTE